MFKNSVLSGQKFTQEAITLKAVKSHLFKIRSRDAHWLLERVPLNIYAFKISPSSCTTVRFYSNFIVSDQIGPSGPLSYYNFSQQTILHYIAQSRLNAHLTLFLCRLYLLSCKAWRFELHHKECTWDNLLNRV